MLKTTFIILSFFICVSCGSQTISGSWQGTYQHSILVVNALEDFMEIEISSDSLITGISHSYYKNGRYSHVVLGGIIHWKDSTLDIEDLQEIKHNFNTKLYSFCAGIQQLQLSKTDSGYYMVGKWTDKSKGLFRCPGLKVTWFKPFEIKKPKPDTVVKHIVPAEIMTRQTDVQALLEIGSEEKDSIKCSVYDNGEIDNDTVSVYFDDVLIVDKKRLSDKPIDFYLTVRNEQRAHKIKLYAENLGRIPPNTAVMVITTKKNRYVVNLSSDLSKNGAVELFFKD